MCFHFRHALFKFTLIHYSLDALLDAGDGREVFAENVTPDRIRARQHCLEHHSGALLVPANVAPLRVGVFDRDDEWVVSAVRVNGRNDYDAKPGLVRILMCPCLYFESTIVWLAGQVANGYLPFAVIFSKTRT